MQRHCSVVPSCRCATHRVSNRNTHSAVVLGLQVPMGLEDAMRGLIDLVGRTAYVFEGASGQNVVGEWRGAGVRTLLMRWLVGWPVGWLVGLLVCCELTGRETRPGSLGHAHAYARARSMMNSNKNEVYSMCKCGPWSAELPMPEELQGGGGGQACRCWRSGTHTYYHPKSQEISEITTK